MEEEKMSLQFHIAFSLVNFNKEQAVREFDIELKDRPDNIAALFNRGLCKYNLAVEKNDKELLQESIEDFKTAIIVMDASKKEYVRPNGIDHWFEKASQTTLE